MSFKTEMMDEIRDREGLRFSNGNERPSVEVWRMMTLQTGFSAHEDRARNIICHTREFKATLLRCGLHPVIV